MYIKILNMTDPFSIGFPFSPKLFSMLAHPKFAIRIP